LLVLPGEISMGVPDAPSYGFAGWCGTAVAERLLLAVEKSAEAVLCAGRRVLLAGESPVGPIPSGVRSQRRG
jgi:hypothetical protein